MRRVPEERYFYELPQLLDGLAMDEALEGTAVDIPDIGFLRAQRAKWPGDPVERRYWLIVVRRGEVPSELPTTYPLKQSDLEEFFFGAIPHDDRFFTRMRWVVNAARPRSWAAWLMMREFGYRGSGLLRLVGFRARLVLRLLRDGWPSADIGALFAFPPERVAWIEASARRKLEAQVGVDGLRKALDDDQAERRPLGLTAEV